MFWVISVYFIVRNILPKSGTFLPGHSVCGMIMDDSTIPLRITKKKCAQNKSRGRVGTDTGNRGGEGRGGGSSSCSGRCSVCVLIHATCAIKIPAQGQNHTPEVSSNTTLTKNTQNKNKKLA